MLGSVCMFECAHFTSLPRALNSESTPNDLISLSLSFCLCLSVSVSVSVLWRGRFCAGFTMKGLETL